MTEAEWVSCTDPTPMLEFLGGRASDRKLRLFAVECCYRIWSLLQDGRSRCALEVSDRYADRKASEQNLRAAQRAARAAVEATDPSPVNEHVGGGATEKSAFWAARAAAEAASPDIAEVVRSVSAVEQAAIEAAMKSGGAEGWAAVIGVAVRADLLRDVMGNPFHASSPLPPAVLAWNDATVRRLAEGIYKGGTFDQLPLLADALLDAGCEDEELIRHCRGEGPHVRGCWALDLILGK